MLVDYYRRGFHEKTTGMNSATTEPLYWHTWSYMLNNFKVFKSLPQWTIVGRNQCWNNFKNEFNGSQNFVIYIWEAMLNSLKFSRPASWGHLLMEVTVKIASRTNSTTLKTPFLIYLTVLSREAFRKGGFHTVYVVCNVQKSKTYLTQAIDLWINFPHTSRHVSIPSLHQWEGFFMVKSMFSTDLDVLKASKQSCGLPYVESYVELDPSNETPRNYLNSKICWLLGFSAKKNIGRKTFQ